MLNKFATAMAEGTYRAVLLALGTVALVTLTMYQKSPAIDAITGAPVPEGERWKAALIAGLIAALAPLVGGSLMAGSDERRARRGIVKPADVPVMIETERRASLARSAAAEPRGASMSGRGPRRYLDEDIS